MLDFRGEKYLVEFVVILGLDVFVYNVEMVFEF